MKFRATHSFDFGSYNNAYAALLKEEDFEFKTKSISLDIDQTEEGVRADISCNSVVELKIATTALIKSLETIQQTLEVTQDGSGNVE